MEIDRITSRDNRRLVNARKVRDGKVVDQIFIEGRRLAGEAVDSGMEIDDCFLVEEFRDDGLVDRIARHCAAVAELPDRIFGSIADTKNPQGIILIAKRPRNSLETIKSRLNTSRLPIVVLLTEINNPSNLGAVLRTAEAAGVAGVIVTRNSADAYSAKALRSSMGAAFRVSILENPDIDGVLNWAKAEMLLKTATTMNASGSYVDADWTQKRLLIFGSEAHGLNSIEPDQIDETVRITMEKDVESLNLAVSAGIILFEARRQVVND